MENLTIEQLQEKVDKASTQQLKDYWSKLLQQKKIVEQASQGNNLAQILMVVKEAIDVTRKNNPQTFAQGTANISQAQAEQLVKDALATRKITLDDMDDQLKAFLTAQAKVTLQMNTSQYQNVTGGSVEVDITTDPLFQKMLSDVVAENNIYLYGTAGSGKTFITSKLAEFLGYEYVEINCNQYTSPLEILGGQTIEGYQEGKLSRAWSNYNREWFKKSNPNERGNGYLGTVLCIDEIPKIDPNTAGLFNSALAKVKDPSKIDPITQEKIPPMIENGRGDRMPKGNIVIVATGNLRLNELSTEYEANFKQDLSLQDRFAGSTYRVDYNYESEWRTMKGFGFLFIPLIKLREKIIENKYTGFAFVSRRIMFNIRDTYRAYRMVRDNIGINPSMDKALEQPKTVVQTINAFLSLFKPDQIDILKQAMDYDNWLKIVDEKNKMDFNNLDTAEELKTIQDLIKSNKDSMRGSILDLRNSKDDTFKRKSK